MSVTDQWSQVAYYAILIGIDTYQEKPLQGSVRDVQKVKQFLEGLPEPVQIHLLTSTKSEDPASSTPTQNSTAWPTYKNVTSAIEQVTLKANAGDYVYIHFSGHGTRGAPQSQFSNHSTGDLALVLLDKTPKNNVRYLWGPTLAIALKAMVDKGLVVNLVLDCCFSASVFRRKDPAVRFLPFDASIDDEIVTDLTIDLGDGSTQPAGSAARDVSMLPNWLINPDGYAIITACGPNEEAREIEGPDKQIHGALSHLLLEVMEHTSLQQSHGELFNQLCAKFQLFNVRQHPVFYGNKHQRFFQHPSLRGDGAQLRAVSDEASGIHLEAGQAHGVCIGDQFLLSPLSSVIGGIPRRAVIARAGDLTSDLDIIDNTTLIETDRMGWTAKPHTKLLLQRYAVRLASSISRREEWVQFLEDRSLLVVGSETPQIAFHLSLSSAEEYQIYNKIGQRIVNLPAMRQDQIGMYQVCDIIQHLANFELVRAMKNASPSAQFQQSFSVHIISGERVFDELDPIEVNHEDRVHLRVENKGNRDLYVFVYYLGSRWQVENVLRGTYEVVPPLSRDLGFTGLLMKKIVMKVPAEMVEKGHDYCEDIIKVFVTSRATSFDMIELPKLGTTRVVAKDLKIERGRSGKEAEDWMASDFSVRTNLK
jgi:hypothetical protein